MSGAAALGRREFAAGSLAGAGVMWATRALAGEAVRASRAADFTRSIGVQIHLNYNAAWGAPQCPYAKPDLVERSLDYLNPGGVGINLVRETVFYARAADYFSVMERLGRRGYRWDIFISYDKDHANHLPQFELLEQLAHTGQVAFIEGGLEVDNPAWGMQPKDIAYRSVGGDLLTGWPAVIAAQRDLYARFRGRIPVALWSLANPSTGFASSPAVAAARAMGTSVPALADLGNVHFYAHHGLSPCDPDGGELAGVIRAETGYSPGMKFVITETGFVDFLDPLTSYHGTPEVNAPYTLRLVLDAFQLGCAATVLYQLFDENMGYTGEQSYEDHWGLFTATGAPKPAAVALRNLMTIIGDDGAQATTFAPSGLRYGLGGMPSGARSMLLQKADRTCFVLVWSEDSLLRSRKMVPARTRPVTLDLGSPAGAVRVYDPVVAAAPRWSGQNLRSVRLELGAGPLVVEVSGPGRGSPT